VTLWIVADDMTIQVRWIGHQKDLIFASQISQRSSWRMTKITGLPPVTLITESGWTATPVHFFVMPFLGEV